LAGSSSAAGGAWRQRNGRLLTRSLKRSAKNSSPRSALRAAGLYSGEAGQECAVSGAVRASRRDPAVPDRYLSMRYAADGIKKNTSSGGASRSGASKDARNSSSSLTFLPSRGASKRDRDDEGGSTEAEHGPRLLRDGSIGLPERSSEPDAVAAQIPGITGDAGAR
jgi:hypothetical protein